MKTRDILCMAVYLDKQGIALSYCENPFYFWLAGEGLKGLQIDMGNIARVIADTVKKDKDKIIHDMLNRTTLYPEQAIEYGLVHEIKSELFPPGSEQVYL